MSPEAGGTSATRERDRFREPALLAAQVSNDMENPFGRAADIFTLLILDFGHRMSFPQYPMIQILHASPGPAQHQIARSVRLTGEAGTLQSRFRSADTWDSARTRVHHAASSSPEADEPTERSLDTGRGLRPGYGHCSGWAWPFAGSWTGSIGRSSCSAAAPQALSSVRALEGSHD